MGGRYTFKEVTEFVLGLLFVGLVLVAMLFGTEAKADDYESTHAWEHMASSFAAEMLVYGAVSRVLGVGTHQECVHKNYGVYRDYRGECTYLGGKSYNRTEAVLAATLITVLATTTYSYFQAMNSGTQVSGHDVLMNSVGTVISIGAIYVFKF